MSELLQSPFAIGTCLLIVAAWFLLLLAIFWPGLGNTRSDVHTKDDGDAIF